MNTETYYNNKYDTDIEMIMDFLKLAILYNKCTNINKKSDIIILEKALIKLLPIANNERMLRIYSIITDIYNIQSECNGQTL